MGGIKGRRKHVPCKVKPSSNVQTFTEAADLFCLQNLDILYDKFPQWELGGREKSRWV